MTLVAPALSTLGLTWLKVSAPIDLEAQARHVSDEQVLPFAQKFFGPWSTLRDLVSLKIFL